MGERADYLAERLDGELQKHGYRRERNPDAGSLHRRGAVYRHKNGVILCVEYKLPHFYRAEEFSGLVGDAILRFGKAGLPRRSRLMLAILLGRMSRKAEADLRDYAARFLPDLQWLLLAEDGRGRIHIEQRDEDMEADRGLRSRDPISAGANRAGLFSPKNQWLWKLLLMPGIDRRYWGGAEQKAKGVSELAKMSCVSQPAVSSFINRAEAAGFLRRGSNGFVVERHQELLEDWVHAIKHSRREVLPLQFVYPEESEEQWLKKVRSFCQPAGKDGSSPPLILGFHLACHLAGLGRSSVRVPWLYAKGKPAEIMAALDLAEAGGESARLSLVVPSSPESVWGGFIWVRGMPVCDILQCYLDVRLSYARGIEQSEVIMDRILRPHFERRK